MSTIVNSLNVIEYEKKQVHVENKIKNDIDSLPIKTYMIKNVFGSMVEVEVHECEKCNKKFKSKEELKKIKKEIKNINIQSLSNEDLFASTFDVIISKTNEASIKIEKKKSKKKSKKEKREAKRLKELSNKAIAGKTRLVSFGTKLNILQDDKNDNYEKMYLLFPIGKLFVQKEAFCDKNTNKNYIDLNIFEFIKKNDIKCNVFLNDERVYPEKQIIIQDNIVLKNNNISKNKNNKNDKITFLVRGKLKSCVSRKHNMDSIIVEIQVIDQKGNIKNININGFYCHECNLHYILDSEYERIRKIGTPLCQIFEDIKYFANANNKFDLNYESILYSFGYNVNAQNNLSDKQRFKILSFIVDNGVLSKSEVISYLNYFINMRIGRKEYKNAISKWKMDINSLNNYKAIKVNKKVESIRVIKYICK